MKPISISFITVLCAFSFNARAATYYCSNAGSDANLGTSDSASWATLAFAKTKLHSNDTLLLKRQDVFRDTLNLTAVSNPVIGAYGPAGLAQPVISGSVAVTGWSVY
jgi:hypothetical protein